MLALLGFGCGNEAIESDEGQDDPMEMQRYYPAPDWNYQINRHVRLVNPDTPAGERSPLELGSNVYQLPDADARAAEVNDDEISLELSGREYLLNRQPGDIVISSEGGVYWRRITEVAVEGEQVRWKVEPAEMTEVFKEAHFFIEIDTRHVDLDALPDIDLAMPYLNPDDPPKMRTRKQASSHDDSCPSAPSCAEPPSEGGSVCVLADNPEVACPLPYEFGCGSAADDDDEIDLDGYPYPCVQRPSCVENNGDPKTMTPCPQDDRDSCDTMGGACRPVRTCNMFEALENYSVEYRTNPWSNTEYPEILEAKPFEATDFTCTEDVDGVSGSLCVVKTCTKPLDCMNYKTVDTNEDTGEPVEEYVGNFPEAHWGSKAYNVYACEKPTLGPDCTPDEGDCDANGECCSGSCVSNQCVNSTGYCLEACQDDSQSKPDGDETEDEGNALLKLLVDRAEVDFIKMTDDTWVDFKFKPQATFEVKIKLFKLKRIALILGMDFFAELGLHFEFDESKNYGIADQKEIDLFTFTVFGYPFSVKLNLHGRITASVAAAGEFKPMFSYYTHKPEGDFETWSEDDNPHSRWRDAYDGQPLPGVYQDNGWRGIQMGMIYGDSPCNESPWNHEDATCKGSGKFYRVGLNFSNRVFDLGIEDASFEASVTAEVGAGVGLYDSGLFNGSKLIGVEPFNLLANAYATIYAPFCGAGASIYYRMFLTFGPLKFLGKTLLGEVKFPLLNHKLWGVDYVMPDDYEAATGNQCVDGDGNEVNDDWVCRISNFLGCGLPQSDVAPEETLDSCVTHDNCPDDTYRCVANECVQQPDGSLRVSLDWTGAANLDLNVQRVDGGPHYSKASHQDDFAETCGDPQAQSSDPNATDDHPCEGRQAFSESLNLSTPSSGEYRIWVTNHGGESTADQIDYQIELEFDGRTEAIEGRLDQPDSGMTRSSLSYILTIE